MCETHTHRHTHTHMHILMKGNETDLKMKNRCHDRLAQLYETINKKDRAGLNDAIKLSTT